MANQQSQLSLSPPPPAALRGGWAVGVSDLRQRDLQRVGVAVDVQDEGVFVGVMLDDVVVHVHQDPETRQTTKKKNATTQGEDANADSLPALVALILLRYEVIRGNPLLRVPLLASPLR